MSKYYFCHSTKNNSLHPIFKIDTDEHSTETVYKNRDVKLFAYIDGITVIFFYVLFLV